MKRYIRAATSFENLKKGDTVVVKEKLKDTAGYSPVVIRGVENDGSFFSGISWDEKYHEYRKDQIVYYASDKDDAMKWISKKIGVPMKNIESCWVG